MKMRQLEAFHAVVACGTMTKASEHLFTSQPSISRMLTDLEAEVGFPLLYRKKGRVEVTPEGFAFFHELNSIYSGVERLKEFARNIRNQRSSHLTISVTPALSMSFLPRILDGFKSHHPDLVVTILVNEASETLKLLKEEEVDVAFCNSLPKLPNTTEKMLINAEFVCVLPPEHPLKIKDIITSDDLAGERFIMAIGEDTFNWTAHEKLLSGMKEPPQIVGNVRSSNVAYGLASQGFGLGIFEPFSASHWAETRVHIRRFKPTISYPYYIYFPKEKIRSRITQELAELAKKEVVSFLDFDNVKTN